MKLLVSELREVGVGKKCIAPLEKSDVDGKRVIKKKS